MNSARAMRTRGLLMLSIRVRTLRHAMIAAQIGNGINHDVAAKRQKGEGACENTKPRCPTDCHWNHLLLRRPPSVKPGADSNTEADCHIRQYLTTWKPTRKPKANRDRGIDMNARDVSERINQREDNETRRECDADVGNGAITHLVDNDRARSGKNERKRPDKLSGQLFHDALEEAQCSSQKLSIFA